MTKKTKIVDFEEVANNLAAELAEANDALLRERADAANVRRRADEDRVKMAGFYKANVVREMLPFLDNLDRALNHAPKDDTMQWVEWLKGIQGVKKQLDDALAKIGVERIATVGEKFDPTLHEAITMEEGDGTEEVVSEELQSGYKLQEEIIRHAMVRVSLK
jgi:molecular chaperone GrpE